MQLLIKSSNNPWLGGVKGWDIGETLKRDGCAYLIDEDYAGARAAFEGLREDEMGERDRAEGAIMCFVTSVAAGDDAEARRDSKIALTAYEFLKAEEDTENYQAVFLHHYALFLQKQGRTAEANTFLQAENEARTTLVPGSTKGSIGLMELNDFDAHLVDG